MNYQGYVIAAYCVFALVMAWDFIAPQIAIRQQLRAAKLQAVKQNAARDASRNTSTELNR